MLWLVGVAAPAQAAPLLVGSGVVAGIDEDEPNPLPALDDELVEPGDIVPGTAPETDPLPPQDDPVAVVDPPEFPEPDVAELEVTDPPPDGGGDGVRDSDGARLLDGVDAGDAPFPLAVWAPPGGGDGDSAVAPGALSAPATGRAGRSDDSDPIPASVTAAVLDADQVRALGGLGLAFTLTRSDGVDAPGQVTVDAVYDSFRFAAGGSLPSRLRLVSMPGCALTTPAEPACQVRTPVDTSNDTDQGILRGVVTVDGDSGAGQAGTDDVSGPTVYVLVSVTASQSGNYAATPVTPTGSWSVGLGSGDFDWSEPLPTVPLPQGGVSAAPALSYSSASVDGRTTAKNPQSSWAGIGWDLSAASITQAFQSCTDAGEPGRGADSCFYTGPERYTLSMNGHSSPLVAVTGSTTHFFMRDDLGWQIFRRTDGGKDAWQVIIPDGTIYLFGWADGTNSIWKMPVYNGSGYTDAPWQWSLTNVYDTSGNMAAYYYTKQTNYFQTFGDDEGSNSVYDRGGFLQHIEFGRVSDGIDTEQPATGELTFATANRCAEGDPCDVPTDLICDADDVCAQDSPSFFIDQRLATVTSAVKVNSWVNVDVMTLTHEMLDTASDTGSQLWLSSVQTAPASNPAAALPPTQFDYALLDNRLDKIHAKMFRVSGITLPTGGTLAITYGMPDSCYNDDGSLPVSEGRTVNRDCIVAYGKRDDGSQGFVWFAKQLVTQVVKSAGVGGADATTETTNYTYLDPDGCSDDVDDPNMNPNPCGPEVHHDDTPYADTDVRGWGVWRGYAGVEVTTGTADGHVTDDVYKILRGMSGDQGTDIGAYPWLVRNVTDYHGHVIEDINWYRDFVYEHDRKSDGAVLEVTTTTPDWFHRDTAVVDDPDDPGAAQEATRMVVDALDMVTTVVPGGTNRVTETDTTYDRGTVSQRGTGMPTSVLEQGDTATGDDDRCTTTSYWPTDEETWILVPHSQVVHNLTCTGTQAARTDTLYDLASGKPTTGLPTEVDAFWGTGSGDHTTTTMSYDSYGRVTSVTVANSPDQTRTTAYSPTTGVPSTVTVTNDYWTESTTTYTTDRHLPATVKDANNHTTTVNYDALGRLSKVWKPTEATTGPASLLYSYAITNNAAPKVTTRTLQSLLTSGSTTTGVYLDTFQFLDGWGRPRETQTVAPTGTGRIVTETRYDDRGLAVAQTAPLHMNGTAGAGLVNPDPEDIGSETRTDYDPLGRVIGTTLYHNGVAMDEGHITGAYFGTYTVSTPAVGRSTTTYLDAYGRTSQIVEGTGVGAPTTTYDYDTLDNLVHVTDADGNETSYTYDELSRRTDSYDQDAGHTHTTYDNAGNVITTTDANDDVVWSKYDKLNRKTEQRDGSSTGVLLDSWTYDGTGYKGLLTAETSKQNGATYTISGMTYDARDRLTGKTYVIPSAVVDLAGSYTFGYGYDAADHRISMTYPAAGGLPAETIKTNYSSRGYEASLENQSSFTYIASTTYTNYGTLAGRAYGGNGDLVRAYDYQPGTRWLDNITTTFNGGTPQNSDYTYDDAADVTDIVTADTGVLNECFTYNDARQLAAAETRDGADCATGDPQPAAPGYGETFAYDAIGNLTDRVPDGWQGPASVHYHYPAGGDDDLVQPHAVTDVTLRYYDAENDADTQNVFTGTYGYDDDGQRTSSSVTTADDTVTNTTLTWNSQHELTHSLTTSGEDIAASDYVYDADGNRLIRDDGTRLTLYLDNTEIRNGAALSRRYYTTGNGTLVGLRVAGGAWTRVLLNHQGSTQYLIKNGDTDIVNVEYQPYGDTRTDTDDANTDRLFLHAPEDDQTGLIQIGARYYDPTLTDFVTPDPLLNITNPQTLNPYRYAANNPETYKDPTGLAVSCGDEDCGFGGIPEEVKEKCLACGYSGQTCSWDCTAFGLALSITNPPEYAFAAWLDYKNGNGPLGTAVVASIPLGGALRLAARFKILERLGGRLSGPVNGITGESGKIGIEGATRLSPSEQATAARLKELPGYSDRTFTESAHIGAEYVDDLGRSYDAVGDPAASEYWNEGQFLRSIDAHLVKSNDFTVVDLTGFEPSQVNAVSHYVGSLPAEEQARIIRIAF